MAMTKAYAARRIQRAFRRRRVKGVIARYRRKGAYIRRTVGLANPTPTFVETFTAARTPANAGGTFAARISDIPQIAQYFSLYKQYRINWIKVMLVPDYNYDIAEPNQGAYNLLSPGGPYGAQGMARIAFAINDSPQLTVPPNEATVLQDNGAKIQTIRNKWSCSFKPVPDVAQTGTAGNPVWARQKYRQWFNFADLATPGNNPLHYGISFFITQGVNAPAGPAQSNTYYKVSFSLRDPQ